METVVVGCKLPHGLQIDLPISGAIERIHLRGNNDARIIGGYGLTPNVPADAFKQWLLNHKDFKYVRKGMVFIESDMARARSRAKEMRNEAKTGMEPLNPFAASHKLSHGLDAADQAKSRREYDAQRANNPDRNRQIVE